MIFYCLLVLSDYRLVGDFAEKCQVDIEGRLCGRVSQKVHSDAGQKLMFHHSQGTVIECLAQHFNNLTNQCKAETAKILELQVWCLIFDYQYVVCKPAKAISKQVEDFRVRITTWTGPCFSPARMTERAFVAKWSQAKAEYTSVLWTI